MSCSSPPICVFPYPKSPGDTLNYGLDWSPFLGTDTISASSWDIPTGLTSSSAAFTTTATAIKLSSGTAGLTYSIKNTITTASGNVIERTVKLRVVER